jgi:hypothetical protein
MATSVVTAGDHNSSETSLQKDHCTLHSIYSPPAGYGIETANWILTAWARFRCHCRRLGGCADICSEF